MKTYFTIVFLLLTANLVFGQWIQTSGPSGGGIYQFAFLSGKILAATTSDGNGVFASTDNGNSWHESGLQGIDLYRIVASGNTALAAAVGDTIYRSSDAGATWQKVWMIQNATRIQSICIHKQKWYVSVYKSSDSTIGGIYRSDDGGENWKEVSEDGSPEARIGGGDVPVLAVDPLNAEIVYSTSIVVWRSEDGGKTWHQQLPLPLPNW